MGAFIGYLLNSLKKSKDTNLNLVASIKALLRSEITSIYYRYTSTKYIPRFEKENLNYLYAEYKKMGGNSYVAIVVEELNNLPVNDNLDK